MSESSIPQPSEGSSGTHMHLTPPPNPAAAKPTSYHGDPINRVCQVVFFNPDQGGQPTITVKEIDGQGDLPGQGPTMDLEDDPGRNEGRPWFPFQSVIEITFYPTGGNTFGIDWIRRQGR